MRKFAVIALLLSLHISSTIPVQAQTRPRRVGNTSPAQPTPTQTTAPSTQSRPVLKTGTTISSGKPSSTQATGASVPTSYEPEEVGEGDVVRVNTTLVSIPVSVMDRNGRFIPDLRQGDFKIFEDGVEQQVAYFAAVEKPFTVALVIDTSASTQFRLEEIQDAAIAFVNQLRRDDRVIVVSFDEDVRVLAEATNDRYVLRDAIRRTETGGNTKLYDAIDLVINERLNRESGRKAVVLFTDGVDTASKDGTYQSNVRDAEELDALIYPVQYDTYTDVAGGGGGPNWPSTGRMPRSSGSILIDLLGGILGGGNVRMGGGGRRGPGGSRDEYMRADAYLHDLAYKTGARVFRADSTHNLTQSFALIAEELRRQYSLGFYPKSQGEAGQRRQLKVRVMRPDLVVRARDSYITGAQSGNPNAPSNSQQSKPELRKRQLIGTR